LEEEINFGVLTILPASHQVTVNRKVVPLTPKEYSILLCLARQPQKAFTRADLLLEVWGDHFTDTRTVDAHVKQLRLKLRQSGMITDVVQTVWGTGYKMGDCNV
jgi:two-component system response regulator ResD